MKNKVVWAVIPARSGSKGFPNKNIASLNGLPLFCHTLYFAFQAGLFDKVLLSTDSEEYAAIGKKCGAWVPFLRSANASDDGSMEEDILKDINNNLLLQNITPPDIIVWLRPTFPFRKIEDLLIGVQMLTEDIDSVRLVVPAESRLYFNVDGFLTAYNHRTKKSMVRRQEFPETFSVYHTDIFWYSNIDFGENFLGTKIKGHPINKICSMDVDTEEDFRIIEAILSGDKNIQ